MSAWPQAVWIIREIQKQFNLNERVLFLENRYYIFAPPVAENVREPLLPQEYQDVQFSDDSIWFVGQTESNENQITDRNVYAISLYHTERDSETGEIIQQGWSDFINFSVDSDSLLYQTSDQTSILYGDDINTIEDALNTLASAYQTIASQTNVFEQQECTLNTSDWISVGSSLITGYTCSKTIQHDFGENPTISLKNVGNTSTKVSYGYIDYVQVDDNNHFNYTFHAIQLPTTNITVLISKF